MILVGSLFIVIRSVKKKLSTSISLSIHWGSRFREISTDGDHQKKSVAMMCKIRDAVDSTDNNMIVPKYLGKDRLADRYGASALCPAAEDCV